MTAPVGYEENGGTTCGSPRTGSAGALGATNAGRAAAAPRALVPIYRFHPRIARRSLYGFKMAVPAPAPKKFLWGARRNERKPAVYGQATPNAPAPNEGRSGTEVLALVGRDGQCQRKPGAMPSPCLRRGSA